MKTKKNELIKLVGLFGHPVEHSFSAHMQNDAFKAQGLSYLYIPFDIYPQNLKKALDSLVPLGFSGINLTLPHKKRAMAFLDKVSDEAKVIGAVNTIVIDRGRLIGHNTDGKGFVTSVEKEARTKLRNKRVVVLGAGGAAHAIATELAIAKVSKISIFNIVLYEAKDLAVRIKRYFPQTTTEFFLLKSGPMLDEKVHDADIIINATSVGMKEGDPLLINPLSLQRKHLVCDVIYNPPRTKLLAAAEKRKARTLNGLGMLIYQGAISFQLWTGKKAPVAVMKRALDKAMRRRKK